MAVSMDTQGITLSDGSYLRTGAARVSDAFSGWEKGHIKLPMVTGGVPMIIQWGMGNITSSSGNSASGYANLMIAFPNNCVSVAITPKNGRGALAAWSNTPGSTTLSISCDGLGFSNTFNRWTYVAIGY